MNLIFNMNEKITYKTPKIIQLNRVFKLLSGAFVALERKNGRNAASEAKNEIRSVFTL